MRLPGIGKAASSDIGHQKKSAPYVPRCLLAASLLALVSAALVGLPATGAAAQSPPTAQPASADIAAEGIAADLAGEDAEDGLAPADALGGPPLGEAIDEVGLLDVLGPDGTYTLRDGDGELSLRLLDPVDAALPDAQTGPALAALAASAATAYTPVANDTASSQSATPSNWLVSDSGQMFLLVGGVNVVFGSRLSQPEISAILSKHGVAPERVSALGELSNAYLVKTASDAESLRLADALSSEPGVDSAVPNLYTPLSAGPVPQSQPYPLTTRRTHSRCTPYEEPWPDKFSACLWHLNADTDYRLYQADPTFDINLGNVWDTTMGAGVTVAVVDGTWEATHEDIRDNVDTARSKLWGGFTGENQQSDTPYHGTAVAGIVGARDNAVGGRGVAPRATLVNYNFLDHQSSGIETTALTLNKNTVAVYNMSYGAHDTPSLFISGDLWRRAVEEGLSDGFGGKGSSYVKAAGNGVDTPGADWASLEDANNHRGVILVCAVDAYGQSASYSEDGASLWVCAPGGDSWPSPSILAPIGKNAYSDRFNGTSASAPVVSGVIALMRSVNADLTWRDVKVILANTAQKNHESHRSWMSGATKYGSDSESYSFSYEYGFGAVDAKAAVEAASSWTLLPAVQTSEAASSTSVSLPASGSGIELSLDVQSSMDFIEHVSVVVNVDTYDMRDYRWTLVSPSGAESLLAPQYINCQANTCGLRGTFHFGSSRHLGENPSGTWKLKIHKHAPDPTNCDRGNGTGVGQSSLCRKINSFAESVKGWKLAITGHASSTAQRVTLSVSPSTVTEGGEADVSVTVGGTAPTQDLVVPLKITDGTTTPAGSAGADYAAPASITVPAGASSASAKLSTTQDDVDEPDETLIIGLGTLPSGYAAAGSASTVTIADDDPLPTVTLKSASASVAEGGSVAITASLSKLSSQDVTLDVSAAPVAPAVSRDGSLGTRTRLTIAAGSTTSTGPVAFSASQNTVYEFANAKAKTFEITAAATGGNGVADPGAITLTLQDDDPPPVVSITAGGGVTEGSAAVFTLIASPAPASALPVSVTVSASGDYGAATGAKTVTVPISGRATLSVHTTGDDTDEADGSVTATLNTGSDYTVSSTAGAATVAVSDDDGPPPPPPPTPVVSITAVGGVTEGAAAKFTVTSTPPPASALSVSVAVTAVGDYGATTGARTITIPASSSQSYNLVLCGIRGGAYCPGTVELSVDTTGDSTDEADGSVTATLSTPGANAGYTVSSTEGAATVAVADDDDPPLGYTVDPQVVTKVRALAAQTHHGTAHVNRWNRVLVAFGEHDGTGVTGGAMTAAQAQQMADTHSSPVWDEVAAELTALEAAPRKSQSAVKPVVSVTSNGDVTEGAAAVFTVTASPAPAADLDVSVTVAAVGDYGVTAGARTVTIPTSGSVTLSVATTGDSADEADGSVTATVNAGSGYTVSSTAAAATAAVADDDDPPLGYTVDPQVVTKVRALAAQTHHGTAHVNRWNRVLVAFGEHDGTGVTGGAMTAAQAQQMANIHSSPVWDEVVAELTALEAAASATPPPPPKPEVSITSSGGVTEGTAVVFTLTASPAPASALPVSVAVAAVGDYGVAAGARTVTIPTSGSATLTVTTTDDSTDEADGSVTATVNTGTGYTVSSTAGAATAAVADNDDPPVVTPEVSITSSGGVTEGTAAVFTVAASPAPAADLDVSVTVAAVGDYGVAAGARTVTIPTSGSATLTVSTTDDSTDEVDGSVTATVNTGTGYTVSSTAGAATAAVADNDDPPVVTPEVSITSSGGVTEGTAAVFTVTASPAPASALPVKVTVSASGDYGVAAGARTVTIPTSGSATLTVATTDDSTDEVDGSVTATVNTGTGYTVSSTAGAATAAVADDDDPPPPTPEVSITSSGGVTEGTAVVFTLTASPAPASALTVKVTVSASGNYGAATGARTVTVPTSGSVTLSVATTDDSADEADGSVTATVNTGTGYTVSSTAGAATAAVADDDPASSNSGSPVENGDITLGQLMAAFSEGHWFAYENGPGCTPLGQGIATGQTVYKCPDN